MAASNGTAMPETDGNGKSSVDGLELGLYLFVETKVPENVVDTTAPFLVSLPMTSTDGTGWNYDLTVYPKNETGNPTLEKTVREDKNDTGKNNGSTDDMTDGYAHTATASDGDTVDYQIISTLPTITSPATALTTYTFVDTLSKGIQYSKNDVQIEFFTDVACTNKVATWTEADGKFSVTYTDYDSTNGSTMTISMTADGLSEINSATTVYDSTTSNLRGYSNLTMRITYSCKVGSDAAVVCGDNGNPNEVTLTWKRTNTDYYDTLNDDCHVYTYGIDLTKEFSDNAGNFSNVKFLLKNDTDNYYVQAELNQAEGIYYVTGHTTKEAEATLFSPMSGEVNHGKILVKGLEDDGYTIIEVATDSGYVLLSENISVEITSAESAKVCDTCGKALLTATAKVNDNAVEMTSDNESASAIVPLTVTNTKGFDLPKTGGTGSKLFYALGILAMITAGATTVAVLRKKKHG
jgi:fimbrial isopeptide formation D2 family protein/LPXTG-motif cell wall-anchored protein